MISKITFTSNENTKIIEQYNSLKNNPVKISHKNIPADIKEYALDKNKKKEQLRLLGSFAAFMATIVGTCEITNIIAKRKKDLANIVDLSQARKLGYPLAFLGFGGLTLYTYLKRIKKAERMPGFVMNEQGISK